MPASSVASGAAVAVCFAPEEDCGVFAVRAAGDAQGGGAVVADQPQGEKLIKVGAKVVSHGRYVTFQLAEVAVSRQMFAEILSLIARLRAPPAPA